MNITRKAQEVITNNLNLEDALPTKMPVYVNSVGYLFGVLSLSSLVLVLATGMVLAIMGPTWYHENLVGHYVNSLHFWSVQVFFGGMILHLLSKFAMGAYRDGRWLTWLTGLGAFGVAIFVGLTGYLSQTNFDSQWIAVQSKDAMNAVGVGFFFDTMDVGQVLLLHVALLPLLVVALVGVHLVLIRREGPVRPYEHPERWLEPGEESDAEWIVSGESK